VESKLRIVFRRYDDASAGIIIINNNEIEDEIKLFFSKTVVFE
jgi:hypothetical protein